MCRQMPVAPDPSAEFLSPFQRFNPSELALPVQPRRAGGERAAAAAVAPSLPPTRLPGCGDGTEPPRPAAGREGERLRGRGEDGPLPPGGAGAAAAAAAATGRLALVLAALNPPASAVRGAARACRS